MQDRQAVSPDWLMKAPGGQRVQLLERGAVEIEPGEHRVQVWLDVAARAVEKEPAAQDKHVDSCVRPVADENEPAGQRSQADRPTLVPNVPAGQFWQEREESALDVFEKVPTGQKVQLEAAGASMKRTRKVRWSPVIKLAEDQVFGVMMRMVVSPYTRKKSRTGMYVIAICQTSTGPTVCTCPDVRFTLLRRPFAFCSKTRQ